MNSDRELLEAAAKAAGIEFPGGEHSIHADGRLWDIKRRAWWNPLTDDGDALKLAVKLNFTVAIRGHECEVFGEDGACLESVPIFGASCFVNSNEATNPPAATRRAIVRAAAAINLAKPIDAD